MSEFHSAISLLKLFCHFVVDLSLIYKIIIVAAVIIVVILTAVTVVVICCRRAIHKRWANL